MMSIDLLAVLALISFVAGIGITAIGPGGIFTTFALYWLSPLSSNQIAGTVHVTFIATGVLGTAAYLRSGELQDRSTLRLAIVLSLSSVLGSLLGVEINTYLSRDAFGALLAVFATVTGVIVLVRQRRGLRKLYSFDTRSFKGGVVIFFVGTILGTVSGLLGVGGPVIAVPVLVILGIPMLPAVAIAQIQSVFIAGFSALGYSTHGAIVAWMVALVGLPQLFGALIGWKVAHRIRADSLTSILGITLIAIGVLTVV